MMENDVLTMRICKSIIESNCFFAHDPVSGETIRFRPLFVEISS